MKNVVLLLMAILPFILSFNCKSKDNNIGVVAQKYGLKFIPGGTFKMGSDSSEFANQVPVHQVTLTSFYMDSTEITQEEYFRLIGRSINGIVDSLNKERTEKIDVSVESGKNYPMFFLSWWDAIKFCNTRSRQTGLCPVYDEKTGECDFSKIGFRLPTEAEWEYACRAHTEGKFYNSPDRIGWYSGTSTINGKCVRRPVSQKKPNAFGLYDMSGNVFEWCNDWQGPYDSIAKINPHGPSKGKDRVVRGGDYINGDYTIMSSFRAGDEPNSPYSNGFRCVLPVPHASEKTVHSLSEIPGRIKSKDGAAVFDQQMNGSALPDGFGTKLPKGISPATVIRLLLPDADTSLSTLTGMKKWPYAPHLYIAITCIAPNKKSRDEVVDYNRGQPMIAPWLVHEKPGYLIGLGVIQYDSIAGTPTVISKLAWDQDSENPLATRWENSNLDGPYDSDKKNLDPQELHNFDFAKYKVNDSIIAFGIRSGFNEGYAGGGANFQMLTLFALIQGTLKPILSEPIYFYKNLAGSWHDDGTRDHEFFEGENIIIMLPHKTDGYYDLKIKAKDDKWSQIFRWYSELGCYSP